MFYTLEYSDCLYCGECTDHGKFNTTFGFQCTGPCKKFQHFNCIHKNHSEPEPIYITTNLSRHIGFCCSSCIDNFSSTSDSGNILNETKSLDDKDSQDITSPVGNIENSTNNENLQKVSTSSISDIETDEALQETDSILKEHSELSSHTPLIINNTFCQLLKYLQMQTNYFKKIKVLKPEIRNNSIDIKKEYLELKKILSSLSESCNEVIDRAQKLKIEISQLEQTQQ
ncbi:hypothetical protein ACS0PU_007106 [Formica fusca]